MAGDDEALEREHWEHQLPQHLIRRSRDKGEQMWTERQFHTDFEAPTARIDTGLFVVRRRSDNIKGTIRYDPSGWYYAWTPDYSEE